MPTVAWKMADGVYEAWLTSGALSRWEAGGELLNASNYTYEFLSLCGHFLLKY